MNKKVKSDFSNWLEHHYQEGVKELIHAFFTMSMAIS